MDWIGKGDPYVLVRFHSARNRNLRTYRTEIEKNSRNPVWNATFSETINVDDDPISAVELIVKEWDRGRRDSFVGVCKPINLEVLFFFTFTLKKRGKEKWVFFLNLRRKCF